MVGSLGEREMRVLDARTIMRTGHVLHREGRKQRAVKGVVRWLTYSLYPLNPFFVRRKK